MDFYLTKGSMELLIEEIIDAYESTDDLDEASEAIKKVLTDNGIMERMVD